MTEPLTVDLNLLSTQSSADELRADPSSRLWSFVAEHHPRRIPLFIPRDETYYWTREWQEGIRESMAAYEAGDYLEFDSDDPDDVARRFSPDENR